MKNMYKIILSLLLLPCLLYGQAKKRPAKKIKPTVFKSTFRPPVVRDSIITPAPVTDAMGAPETARSIEKITSLQHARQLARQYKIALVLFVPYSTDESGNPQYNTVFPDSMATAAHLDELLYRANPANGYVFIPYMPNAAERKILKENTAALYPAWIFYSVAGSLAGKRAGVKMDAYDVDKMQMDLQDANDKKLLVELQQKFRNGLLDDAGLEDLVLVTQRYNRGNYDRRTSPDESWLLDTLVARLVARQEKDSLIIRLIEKVCVREDYVLDISQPHVFHYLVTHYNHLSDEDFKWYRAISDHFVTGYGAVEQGLGVVESKIEETPMREVAPPAPVITPISPDTMVGLHGVFVRQLRNVQLLSEASRLLQKQYNLFRQQELAMPYVTQTMLPTMRWFADTVLHVNQGMDAMDMLLNKLHRQMPPNEQAVLPNRYADFNEFAVEFKKDFALLLNNISWLFFQDGRFDEQLPGLLAWSKASLEIEKRNFYFLDTYAHLLYVLGDRKAAVDNQLKAIAELQTNKLNTAERWMIPQMQAVLNTMKKGGDIGRKDYIAP
jgi:hypothetical protein